MILKILHYPNLMLTKSTQEVNSFNQDELNNIINDMIETMNHHDAIGLAANQVGIDKSIFIMNVEGNELYFINPIIINKDDEKKPFVEGCLSFPGLRNTVNRPNNISLKFKDINGEEHQQDFSGLEAICIQHEIDHLNGITFIDNFKAVKKQMVIKKYLKNKDEFLKT